MLEVVEVEAGVLATMGATWTPAEAPSGVTVGGGGASVVTGGRVVTGRRVVSDALDPAVTTALVRRTEMTPSTTTTGSRTSTAHFDQLFPKLPPASRTRPQVEQISSSHHPIVDTQA